MVNALQNAFIFMTTKCIKSEAQLYSFKPNAKNYRKKGGNRNIFKKLKKSK